MNVEIGTVAEQLLFWEYFSNFLYCVFVVHLAFYAVVLPSASPFSPKLHGVDRMVSFRLCAARGMTEKNFGLYGFTKLPYSIFIQRSQEAIIPDRTKRAILPFFDIFTFLQSIYVKFLIISLYKSLYKVTLVRTVAASNCT
jgi:hypothetical protein